MMNVDAGCRMPDAGCRMPDAGCRMPDAGCLRTHARGVAMELGLAGRRALVTGAAGGIGRAVAVALAAEGVSVALVDRRAPDDVAADVAGRGSAHTPLAIAADVTDEAQVAASVSAVAEAFGGLDLVVGCAGISGPVGTPLTQTSLADWHAVLDVNVTGAFLLLKHALPVLQRSDAGSAVFVASDSALVAAPGMAPYCASKAALVQLVRAASVETVGVRINAVCPSIVDTPMSRGDLGLDEDGFAGMPYPVQTAADVADEVLFLCSPRARAIDAAALVSDFGYTARSNFPA
jgi:NAD(P)-dependent dehydrogenase (short-subunit alcohol dehydrogenase family)